MTIDNPANAGGQKLFSRRVMWLTLLLVTLSALAIVVVPVWIIQPFKGQTARGLEVSYALRRWSPLVTFVVVAISLVLVSRLWRGSRWWKKALLVMVFIPLMAATWFARQNHFEWMFNPLPNAAYAKAGTVEFVGDGDIVLAVESNGESVAYPVRLMAYHHVVDDVVGGIPIVATY
jgi:hypothetical protein